MKGRKQRGRRRESEVRDKKYDMKTRVGQRWIGSNMKKILN